MAKKVGTLIKEARTAAGLTQEQLARKVKTLTASDISKAERGEKDLTTDQLKEIAKITGVTQKSLLDAAKGTSAGKTAAKTSSAKKTSSSGTSAKKTSASSGTSVKLTATEKKVIELYREADSDTKKTVMSLLKGESQTGLLANLLGGKEGIASLLGNGKTGLGDLLGSFLKEK